MEIRTSQQFFEKLELERKAVNADLTDHRHAINAALNAWHLYEWIWGEKVKGRTDLDPAFFGKPHFRKRDDFLSWAVGKCSPALGIMQGVADGSKHFDNQRPLEKHRGSFSRAFSKGFDVSRIKIEDRYFDTLLDEVVGFWREVLGQF